jgi:hypothetical protein
VTIAKRPSVLGRDGKDEEVIWVKSEPKYFCEGGWTGDTLICPVGQIGKRSEPENAQLTYDGSESFMTGMRS